MELSKEQISFIDQYLKKKGVKYWDVRLEMVDHVASKLEKNDKLFLDEIFLIEEFGLETTIKKIVSQKIKMVNKKYNKLFLSELIDFFKNIKNIVIFTLTFLVYFQLFNKLSEASFKRVSLILLLIPVAIAMIYMLINFVKQNKSIHLIYAMTYLTFPFMIINLMVQLTNPDGVFGIASQYQVISIFIIIPFFLVFMFCGFKVYRRTHREYTDLLNQLKMVNS